MLCVTYFRLVTELGIRSPGGVAKHGGDPSPHAQAAGPVKTVAGEQLVKNAQKKARSMLTVDTKPHPQTPARDNQLMPQSITMETRMESMEEDTRPKLERPVQPVSQESPSSEHLAVVAEFCRAALGRGVLSLTDLRNRLLLKQTSLTEGSPLHVLSQQGVSDHLLGEGLRWCGAVEVGQPWNKSLFALTHGDPVRIDMTPLLYIRLNTAYIHNVMVLNLLC